MRAVANHPYKVMDDFLVFNSDRNQFKWTGSVEQFESFMFQRLNVLKEDVQEVLFQSLGHPHQDSTADETVFGNEAGNPSIEPAPSPLISDGMSEGVAQDDVVPAMQRNTDTIDSASATKHLPKKLIC